MSPKKLICLQLAIELESVVLLLLHDDNLTHPSVRRKPPSGLTSPLRHLWRILGWLMKRVFPVLSPVAAAAFCLLKQYILSAYYSQQCTSCLASGPFHSMRSLGLAPIEAACRAILGCGGTPCQVYLRRRRLQEEPAHTILYIHTVSNAFNWLSWATIPAFNSWAKSSPG